MPGSGERRTPACDPLWMALGLLLGCLVGLVVSGVLYEHLRSRFLALKAAEADVVEAAVVAVRHADVVRMVRQ